VIARRRFGRTGHASSCVLFGGEALRGATPERAAHALDLAAAHGVNHVDTAPLYGESEALIGDWLAGRRDVFVATKTLGRTYLEARLDLERSLERLRLDAVDLWQMHKLDEDEWEVAMGPEGAIEAFVEARDQGLARFLGVTAHGAAAPRVLRRSLEAFDFDAVLVPYSFPMTRAPGYAAEVGALLDECARRDVAVQTIKAIARGPWRGPPTRNPWYEPLEDQADIDDAVHWVLARPEVFLNAVGDVDLLPRVLDAAERAGLAADRALLEARLGRLALEPLVAR